MMTLPRISWLRWWLLAAALAGGLVAHGCHLGPHEDEDLELRLN